jgi:hypothetical protein
MGWRGKLLALPAAGIISVLLATTAAASITALTFDRRATLTNGGTNVTVTGLYACDVTDININFQMLINQTQRGGIILAQGRSGPYLCDGTPHSYVLIASTSPGDHFIRGAARGYLTAYTRSSDASRGGILRLHW